MEENMNTLDILHNSQAFSRITELARKAGALHANEDYFVDSATGRFRSMRRSNERKTSLSSSSSGVSSASSLLNTESTIVDDPTVNYFDEDDVISAQFTGCIRELFLQRFVQMFLTYEKFVIVPSVENGQIDTWWSSREYSGNFDSKMFLIEQPSPRLPFLSHFIATQMFVSFIDLKIISLIDASKNADPNVKIFDDRIRRLKENELNGMSIYEIKTENLKSSIDIKEIGTLNI